MIEVFAHSYILLFSIGLQYYFMNKFNHHPAMEMVMEIQMGNWKAGLFKFLELNILVYITLFLAKSSLIILCQLLLSLGIE